MVMTRLFFTTCEEIELIATNYVARNAVSFFLFSPHQYSRVFDVPIREFLRFFKKVEREHIFPVECHFFFQIREFLMSGKRLREGSPDLTVSKKQLFPDLETEAPVVCAIDFGTARTGYAYVFTKQRGISCTSEQIVVSPFVRPPDVCS
jgi:hypothetical protein